MIERRMASTENTKLHFFPQAKPARSEGAPSTESGWSKVARDLLLLTPLLLFVCFYGLNDTSIHHVDETTHTRVTQEMLRDGEWWHPKVFGESYFNKPPFKMWLTAIPVYLFGESNYSYRVVDGLCGTLTALSLYFFGLYLFRSRIAAIMSVVTLLSCRSYVFVHGVRTSTQDAMLLLMLTLAMICAYLFLEKLQTSARATGGWTANRLAILGGLFVGLGVLTKNVAGFLPLMMLGVYLVLSGDLLRVLRAAPKQIFAVVLISFLVPALYLVPRIAYEPHLLSVMFGDEVMDRVSDGYHNREIFWFYFKRLFRYRAAVPPELIVAGTVFALFGMYFYDRRKYLFLLVWAVFPVILFTFVPSRLTWYMAPAFPGMALLSGAVFAAAVHALSRSIRQLRQGIVHWRPVALVLVCVVICGQSLLGLKKNYDFILDRIIHPPTIRLVFDRLTESVVAAEGRGRRLTTILFDTPQLGRNEKLYLDMQPDVRRVDTLDQLKEVLATLAPKSAIVYGEADKFQELAQVFPFTSYAFLPPANHRNRWAVIYSNTDVHLPALLPARYPVDFDRTPGRFLSGWSSAGLYHDITVRRSRGPASSIVLPGDRAKYAFGTFVKLNVSSLPVRKGQYPSVQILLNGLEVAKVDAIRSGFRSYDFQVPPGMWVNGQNVMTLRFGYPDGSAIGLQEELAMVNWMVVQVNSPLREAE
jgi:4-amino-4-deoxy-L-arabinose transferase-like glycosyltransferase